MMPAAIRPALLPISIEVAEPGDEGSTGVGWADAKPATEAMLSVNQMMATRTADGGEGTAILDLGIVGGRAHSIVTVPVFPGPRSTPAVGGRIPVAPAASRIDEPGGDRHVRSRVVNIGTCPSRSFRPLCPEAREMLEQARGTGGRVGCVGVTVTFAIDHHERPRNVGGGEARFDEPHPWLRAGRYVDGGRLRHRR